MAKDNTKKQILEALARLLSTKGFQSVGINAIAREAGVDKVLIYRYFENLPNLLKTFASEEEFWPTIENLLGTDIHSISDRNSKDILLSFFASHIRELVNRPMMQAIMCWQFIQQNELTDALTSIHEKQGTEFIKMIPEKLVNVPGVDVIAALVLIHSGINFLILRAKTSQAYAGIDLHSEEGWGRLENGIQTLVEALMAYAQSRKETTETPQDV